MGFFRNKPMVVTVITVVVLIVLMSVTSSSNIASGGTTAVGSAFLPLQQFFNQASDSVGSFFGRVFNVDGEAEEQRQAKLDEDQLKLSRYDEVVAENERLSEMLDYKQNNPEQELIVAKITGKNPGNWFDVFTIDRGREHGIEVNMPVITPDGLVGRVEEVGLNWAKVMSIIDGRSSVSAIVERTRDYGVVKGHIGTDDLATTLYMEYMPIDTDIVLEDTIVTSGLDQLYPKGLVIGEVIETMDEFGGKTITVKPNVDFRRLEEVMVIRTVEEQQPESSEDISDGAPAVTNESVAPPEESYLPEESLDGGQPAGGDTPDEGDAQTEAPDEVPEE
ncbi:MAG: rod shape-determining protein MreC [Christensenellaceae bacterium]